MANEFKIKNGLLLEGSTNSVPVLAIRNSSTGINADASSLLFTGKAIFDYVTSQAGSSTLAGLADVQITSISDNQFLRYDYDLGKWINVSPTEASLYFWSLDTPLVRESSLGSGLYWVNGMLDVSIAAGVSSLSSLTDVSIVSIADNDLLQYDLASGKWKNVALTDASNYFWLSSIPLLREASIGSGLYWANGMLDVSVTAGGSGNVSWASGNIGSNNQILTAAGDGSIVAESSLYFTGTKLGIGTPDPSAYLHLYAPGGSAANFVMSGDGEQGIRMYNTNPTGKVTSSIKFANRSNTDWQWIWYNDDNNDGTEDFTIANRTEGNIFYCSSVGNIGLGSAFSGANSPTTRLAVSGDASISGSIYNSGMSNASTNDVVYYNTTTKKLTYATAPAGGDSLWDVSTDTTTVYLKDPSDNVELSFIEMRQDGGPMLLIDLPIVNPSVGVEQSYDMRIDGSSALKIYGNGSSGSLSETAVVMNANYFSLGDPKTDGSWRLKVDASGLEVEKRVGGVWVNKGNFS